MLPNNQRSAIAALDAARPVVARLDVASHPDDVAADLIESWSAVETALRSLLGGSSLTGQALVSEVRQRGLLDYGHAHALLGFLAARDRVSRTDYRPTETDVDAARAGFQSVEAALGVGIGADTATYPAVRISGAGVGTPPPPPSSTPPRSAPRATSVPPAAPPVTETYVDTAGARRSGPGIVLGAIVLLLLIGVGAWAWLRGSQPSSLQAGVTAFQRGDRVSARREFEQAAADRPKMALPHVYLARMARQDGDLPRAFNELKTAVTLEPNNELAQREMGQYLLQAGRPDQAVKWFERALRLDATDKVASGWMGCALQRQGQTELAARFFQRAGSGDWTVCQQTAPMYPPAMQPGAVPPGAVQPGVVPPGAVPQGTPAPAVPRP
jgi:tetratricopeptide (TPR) repeat protein